MSIYEMARELGRGVLDSDEAKRLEAAKAIFYQNQEAQKCMEEYKSYQTEIQNKLENGDLNKDEFKAATKKLTQMGTLLKADAITGELIEAESEFTKLFNKVVSIFRSTVTGDDNLYNKSCSGCAGNCSSCE